ncbi:DUF4430 domain-containing protein [Paenibacillus glycanilyticus]|uniref:DUF4430 domain-containing protein n=1 Tax=Paenibacillus glycanilyticus TaxID=126569 RepID=UPI002041828A|nr:DUF4430 domain-containing protein [Paenibacillus glycanilyticus]MCM3629920.1 DUF4430 domain-containing protein [Paenibacillus glycanilyticus]
MNKKITAMLIVGVLAIAYFWGGNYANGPSSEKYIAAVPVSTEDAAITASPDSSTNPALSGQQPFESASSDPISSVQEQSDTKEYPQPTETASSGNTEEQSPEPSNVPKASPAPSASAKPSVGVTDSGKGTETTPATKPPAATPEGKDKYQTDPVPSGKPQPVEWQDVEIDKNKSLTVTLSVSAATILNNLDSFNEDKREVLPKDGMIYKAQKVTFYEGESVFDVLLREMKKNKIHMEFEMTPIYNSNYIEGINNIYEFDCGELSGWMYKVNGWFPNYGASRYALKDGDIVEWVYTCDLGRDVGGYSAGVGDKS